MSRLIARSVRSHDGSSLPFSQCLITYALAPHACAASVAYVKPHTSIAFLMPRPSLVRRCGALVPPIRRSSNRRRPAKHCESLRCPCSAMP